MEKEDKGRRTYRSHFLYLPSLQYYSRPDKKPGCQSIGASLERGIISPEGEKYVFPANAAAKKVDRSPVSWKHESLLITTGMYRVELKS